MWDVIGKKMIDVGRRLRKGLYAYRGAEDKHRYLARPEVKLHRSFPGPEMSEYHGSGGGPVAVATGDGGCGD